MDDGRIVLVIGCSGTGIYGNRRHLLQCTRSGKAVFHKRRELVGYADRRWQKLVHRGGGRE